MYHVIDEAKWLNNPFSEENLNKIYVLNKAKDFGIKIPYSRIVSNKIEILKIMKNYPDLIVKPLSECIFLHTENDSFKMLTKKINKKDMKEIPEVFFPSLIQERIDKILEIRAFYFNDKFYSMAIFSQENKKTTEDFRNYDDDTPNRTVPYQLPITVEEKLILLMKFFKFRIGSIDLLLNKNNEYIFLEVNPEGQFGMVSYPCNYYLEKEIALYIQKKNDEKKNYQ